MLLRRFRFGSFSPSIASGNQSFGTAVPISLVSKLRKDTGASIQKCKDALEKSGNDIESAINLLRKRGEGINATQYGKLAGSSSMRLSASVSPDRKFAVVSKTVTQTDFAAESELFVKFSEAVNSKLSQNPGIKVDDFIIETSISPQIHGISLKDITSEISTIICEPVAIESIETIKGDLVSVYVHNRSPYSSHVGGMAVAVSFTLPHLSEEVRLRIADLGDRLARQVLATSPKYIRESDIPASVIENEREVLRSRVTDPTKLDKAFQGHMKRFVNENCLLSMEWIIPGGEISHEGKSVGDALKAECEALGVPCDLVQIDRMIIVR